MSTRDMLPKTYTPSGRAKLIVYALALVMEGGLREVCGFTINLEELLEVTPSKARKDIHILRFNVDGTSDLVYKWNGGCKKKPPHWALEL